LGRNGLLQKSSLIERLKGFFIVSFRKSIVAANLLVVFRTKKVCFDHLLSDVVFI
jgi:hypothetical protein